MRSVASGTGGLASWRPSAPPALCLVLAEALLSTVLTNDVALFVVVPSMLGVCGLTEMPATELIVFETLAVDARSALAPIGKPENPFM